MVKIIDDFLNKITMYRLVLYCLIILVVIAIVFGFFNLIPYSPINILLSTSILLLIAWITNKIFSRVFAAPTNIESVYITALILALIIKPAVSISDYIFLFWAAILSMASKYILTIGRKHVFNPAAIAVVITLFGINQSANWWVGNAYMFLPVLIMGLLIVRKIQREEMINWFIFTAITITVGYSLMKGTDVISSLSKILIYSPMLFFATIMLAEPLTSPVTKNKQILYGILVGILFSPQIHFGSIYTTPELALIAGNIFSYLISPKEKLVLKLKEKIKIADNTYDFIFPLNKKINFIPGQYMEWTLPHEKTDSRGNRRYFTLSSSPTEDNIRIGLKFYDHSSSFKNAMLKMSENSEIVASQRAGDFVLPNNPTGKYVFMAGGIGITPFRSILKYLIDNQKKVDIAVVYSNRNIEDIAYQDILEQAQKELGIKVVLTLTNEKAVPNNWKGSKGRVHGEMIKKEIPDYLERKYYLSGPRVMVTGFEQTLQEVDIKKSHIKTDFFPGFV